MGGTCWRPTSSQRTRLPTPPAHGAVDVLERVLSDLRDLSRETYEGVSRTSPAADLSAGQLRAPELASIEFSDSYLRQRHLLRFAAHLGCPGSTLLPISSRPIRGDTSSGRVRVAPCTANPGFNGNVGTLRGRSRWQLLP